jgi:3-deoxy-7-phosphoheptulonate synthase
MILKLAPNFPSQNEIEGFHIKKAGQDYFICSSSIKNPPKAWNNHIEKVWVFDNDIQLASNKFEPKKTDLKISGEVFQAPLIIAGPCSVESEAQIREVAQMHVQLGLKHLRAGAFKPRTSPYSFQGLGLEGLKILRSVCNEFELKLFSETKDATNVEHLIEYADVVQVGTKAIYDQGILRALGQSQKTVLLKRGFSSTLQEFVQMAEFVLCGGNENVWLCERGIRTFENKTRFTLDLTAVAWLQEYCNLPVIVDPSHALGSRYGIEKLAKAALAMQVDGVLIEVHPNPSEALSDSDQQLSISEFRASYERLKSFCDFVYAS